MCSKRLLRSRSFESLKKWDESLAMALSLVIPDWKESSQFFSENALAA
jgi:hypothetical protein